MKLFIAFTVLGLCVFPNFAQASIVGDIQVCYFCSAPGDNFGFGVQDGPIFAIDNTSGTAITNATLTIGIGGDNAAADTFKIGTIAAGGQFLIETGVTSDGGSGHTFFAVIGGPHDTSDVGPDSDSIPFFFSGMQGLLAVSANFTPGDTAGPSVDGSVSHLNFLGGPAGADGPCGNCFSGKVASLSTPSTVPEPSSLLLLGTGLFGLIRKKLTR